MMKIEGCVAVVTGGARGIGKAITKALLQNKAKVYFIDINANEGKNIEKGFHVEFGEGMATFLDCDVRDKGKFEGILSNIVQENGHLDILCNNAGIGHSDDINKILSINLAAVIQGTFLGIKFMEKNNGGCIVNMASTAGLTFYPQANCVYTASKHGVVGFTRTYAKVAIRSGVRMNCICPTFVDTEMSKEAASKFPEVKELLDIGGTQTVDVVAEGFIQLLNDEDKIGEAMRITVKNGIDYHSFPPDEDVPL